MKLSHFFVFFLPLLCAQTGRDLEVTQGSGRKALLIGNKSYKISPLTNSSNDAIAMGKALTSLGFRVEVLIDANLRQIEQGSERFVSNLKPGDVAVFFYAGHGVQVNSENYLIPVDFPPLRNEQTLRNALPFSKIKSMIEKSPARLSIMILDSCRNNPFAQGQEGQTGLAPLEAGLGSYIVFAAGPGQTASDNSQASNGLFTTYLLEQMKLPVHISELFRRVRQNVFLASNKEQRPYLHDQIIGDFYLNSTKAPAASQPAVEPLPDLMEQHLEQAKQLYAAGRCSEAVKLLDPLVRARPRNYYARNAAGLSYACLNMASQAIEEFSRAILVKPDYAAAYLNRGIVFLDAAQYELAIDDFNWALEQEPQNAVLYFRRGKAKIGLRRYEEAQSDFTASIGSDPNSAYSFHSRGKVFYQLGKYKEALQDYDAALLRKKDFTEAKNDRSRVLERLSLQAK